MGEQKKTDGKIRMTITVVWLLSFVCCCGGSAVGHSVVFGGNNSIWRTHSLWDVLESAEWGLANGFLAVMFVGICATAASDRRWRALVVVIGGSAVFLLWIAAQTYDWLLHAG